MVYNTWNYCFSGLFPLSGILNDGIPAESTVSQELLWLRHGESSGTQEGDRSPLEAGTRGLVKEKYFLIFRIPDDGQSPEA
jgi:hypothetical protein